MITCPVCEHVQASGDECEVCGRMLAKREAGTPAPAEPALHDLSAPWLETGRADPVGPLPPTPLPDLEPTLNEAGAPLHEPMAPWIESDRAAPVGSIPDAPVPDLEPHRAEPVPDDGQPTGQGPVICRYCRTAAAPGDGFCGRCGMRLPRFDAVAVALSELGEMVCPECGGIGEGPRCRRCGSAMVSR